MLYPEMVKTNSRYRGPRESRKHMNVNRDIVNSIQQLQEAADGIKTKRTDLQKTIYEYYNTDHHQPVSDMVITVDALRGGELK